MAFPASSDGGPEAYRSIYNVTPSLDADGNATEQTVQVLRASRNPDDYKIVAYKDVQGQWQKLQYRMTELSEKRDMTLRVSFD